MLRWVTRIVPRIERFCSSIIVVGWRLLQPYAIPNRGCIGWLQQVQTIAVVAAPLGIEPDVVEIFSWTNRYVFTKVAVLGIRWAFIYSTHLD